jgi:pimeloyl-ACP methyl ester carboxylesterase
MRTIVLIHGAAMSARVWDAQSAFFRAQGHPVLVPDLPGCGDTPGPHLPSVAAMAEWLWRWIDARAAGPVALVGHSLSGLIAVRAASLRPARVERLVMVASMLPLKVAGDFLALAKRNDPRAFDMMEAWCAGEKEPRAGLVDPGMAMVRASAPGVLHDGLNACDTYATGADDLARYDGPRALVLGNRDLMVPLSRARRFGEPVPNMTIVVLDGVGHNIPVAAPDALNRALHSILG